ncbi:hypothetical protein OAX78_04405, partial [Planctomycetota bacterium]|nr:hypothetical protein [Planctomycetota bacterium]
MSARRAAQRAFFVTALIALSGCGTFDVHLAGSLGSPGPGTALGFDANGVPSISSGLGKRRVYLPAARDDNAWGLVVVDGRGLPPAWR